ncbi:MULTISPECIES: c-type cytochrome biogenesis protein CcmI [Salinivibrio]|uniref:C-type cytochrome biogenesis protein CcmI n=1 Tax=Salinivibrio proteolyticus TaxID=334715 RepID=A0ABY7LA80_9GAMM|nr:MULTISPECIES: c-type cytochrome biogenesis protein CcmI [Salinivibrio]OOF09224.1 c-type cytochrome biogenesis protein CcmI [Salinivibrio sp. PR5]OOF15734.1 c-type cytochrome biogenesis protein CcmI [Salinivibrio sp. PR919]OOF19539.1 c-type cytochrome biogenesis protein CcmI [Salinivibrio sp. PR932]OOF30461.1 c-type cytochrome biogenesis protein CcmI [Salinivibrio proteolyticus]WBA14162.1 c-type cytochrome biogenesis protein CcmI [Salinivibrio proteolyticus]
MMEFWSATLVLFILGAVMFLWPLWQKKDHDHQASRDALNKAFYFDRVNEIKAESAEGLIENEQDLTQDLQQSLLDDIPEKEKARQARHLRLSPMQWIPGLIVLAVVSFGLYGVKGSANQVADWQATAENLPALSKKLLNNDQPMSQQEMQDLTLALRTRLQYEPDDSTGWLLLGRIGLANRDRETAKGAMEKAYALSPSRPEIQIGLAQALLFAGSEVDSGRAETLLRSVVSEDPFNLQAMSLLAYQAFEQSRFNDAIATWKAMKTLIGPDDPRNETLDQSIARAQLALNAAQGAAVEVKVSLGEDVTLPDNGVLIVSAHESAQAPMPLAAKRLPLSKFPVTVRLSDTDSLNPNRALSSPETLVIKARIDADGNVATKNGDWVGSSQPVKIGQAASVTIDKQQ